ncbi:MAG: hypothetical protein JNJ46_09050 [Myxococcales bacterium]|nr:hypothetical protein [Myxococcales bacterium]
MPRIRDENTGTEELLRDARYHYAALLADPETAHLSASVKKQMDALQQAEAASQDADLVSLEKQALWNRAEYLHDQKQRVLELWVQGAVGKNRRAPAYAELYPHGLSDVIALSGEEQERRVGLLVSKLGQHHADLHKKVGKELEKLAQEATLAEKAQKEAETAAEHAYLDVRAARSELSRQLRRNEGALISLFPGDRARIRLYYRRPTKTRPEDPTPTPQPPPAPGPAPGPV